jgi:cytochrome c oxidase subunit 2
MARMSLFEGIQSALAPASAEAEVLAEMAWVLFIGAATIFVLVMALGAWSVLGKRSSTQRLREGPLIVGGGIVFPTVTLAALLVYTLMRGEAVQTPTDAVVRIEVTGEQWWWRVRYLDADGRPDFETANEIRIPAGKPVLLELKTADVIHSFWVPSLAGKLDMIPGRTNRLRLLAARTGEYRGQCAEYCGGPHALMAFLVFAEDEASYERWTANQRTSAGQTNALFLRHCAACHTVRGTPAAGTRGPDLTHVASRKTIGAALLPMNQGAIAGWIASSQHLKPGNLMPAFQRFGGEELRGIAAYVASLE